ncbi:UNVERIFIED_CONTAM: hypothetical protein NCL1_26664 [Trichonephila clavipes]
MYRYRVPAKLRSLQSCSSFHGFRNIQLKNFEPYAMASPKATSEDENEGERIVKRKSMTPDWGADAINSVHLWCHSSASGDLCYVSSNVCLILG